MNVIIATVVKDEAHRYWESALNRWSEFADRIIVLDDGSTDDTRSIAEACGKVDLFTLPDAVDLWGKEAPHRSALFTRALRTAEEGDVIFWLDADMIPSSDPRKFFQLEDVNTWAFALHDLWGRDEHNRLVFRRDGYWVGHNNPRVWAIRRTADLDAAALGWPNARGIHSGHIPSSYFDLPDRLLLTMPNTCTLLHYGYHTPADRAARSQRYSDVRPLLSPDEIAHADTIEDDNPSLRALPWHPQFELVRATDQ